MLSVWPEDFKYHENEGLVGWILLSVRLSLFAWFRSGSLAENIEITRNYIEIMSLYGGNTWQTRLIEVDKITTHYDQMQYLDVRIHVLDVVVQPRWFFSFSGIQMLRSSGRVRVCWALYGASSAQVCTMLNQKISTK